MLPRTVVRLSLEITSAFRVFPSSSQNVRLSSEISSAFRVFPSSFSTAGVRQSFKMTLYLPCVSFKNAPIHHTLKWEFCPVLSISSREDESGLNARREALGKGDAAGTGRQIKRASGIRGRDALNLNFKNTLPGAIWTPDLTVQ